MGIQGLLPLLKSIHKPTHLRNFAGQTLGIDAYGWLHRGTVSCAIELAQHKPTRKHIDFALSRVRMLIHFGVNPYMVFDGAYLPSKEHTERDRAARRKESKRLGLELLSMGKLSQAYLELQKAVDVTPLMARELIEELKRLGVQYVVAPYEADSQLAYLEKRGVISGVISEDSDLLVFGVQSLLTKLDQYGECVTINRADFTACREISLVGWTDKEFRMMAMLSGCDYLPGIDKMGLKTAYRLVRKHKALERLVRAVQFDGKMKVPTGYLEAYKKAENTFLYQWVYCPEAKCLVNLNTIPKDSESEDMHYIGEQTEASIAVEVAAGNLDPNTKERLTVTSVPRHPPSRTSIVQTPDEKQGKPISEFFKPRRTPLAELDPNSFTPSPSQQALLQSQQGRSWSASQIQPSQLPAVNRISGIAAPLSAPQFPRRAISEQVRDMQRKSPKRQRLCSESMLNAAMTGSANSQQMKSRFFSRPEVQPSPSLRKPSAQRKNEDEFELWSDDPAAEAAAELASIHGSAVAVETASPKKRKKIKVFIDPAAEVGDKLGEEHVPPVEESQETVTTVAPKVSQSAGEDETPSTSFESLDHHNEGGSIFSKGIDADFAALKAKFTFQAASSQKRPSRTKSAPLQSRDPLLRTEHNALLGRLSKYPPVKKAFVKNNIVPEHSPGVLEKAAVAIPNSSPPPRPEAENVPDENEDLITDEEWLEMEQRQASPITNLAVQGSEDLLIPNSPDSRDSDKSQPMLNLGRFAFAG